MANGSRGLVVIKIIASCFSSILLIGPPLSYLNPVDPNTQHPARLFPVALFMAAGGFERGGR
jgi:hypothetical protein